MYRVASSGSHGQRFLLAVGFSVSGNSFVAQTLLLRGLRLFRSGCPASLLLKPQTCMKRRAALQGYITLGVLCPETIL
jgi:hypothetical protein